MDVEATTAIRQAEVGAARGVFPVEEHTVRSYDKELDMLECRIAETGGIAKKMVIDAMDALANAFRIPIVA